MLGGYLEGNSWLDRHRPAGGRDRQAADARQGSGRMRDHHLLGIAGALLAGFLGKMVGW